VNIHKAAYILNVAMGWGLNLRIYCAQTSLVSIQLKDVAIRVAQRISF
jgi:hypothetical protein